MSRFEGRSRRFAGVPERVRRRLGAVRRTQLVTTYGVGALIAVENESFIVAGVDTWDLRAAPRVEEPRLARLLGVDGFRLPPAPEESGGDGVRVRRFPEWYSCTECGRLAPFRTFGASVGKSDCADCDGAPLVPSRFVLACLNGHLGDFPYHAWVHRGTQGGEGRHELRLTATGASASLRSVVVSCSCGRQASMEGAFRRRALGELKIHCPGTRPWLSGAREPGCREAPRTLQRGSSAAWFPVVRSALSIPPWSEGLHRLLAPHLSRLIGETDADVATYLRMNRVLRDSGHTVDDVLRLLRGVEGRDDQEESSLTFDSLRLDEYRSLLAERPEASRDQDFVCVSPAGDPSEVRAAGIGTTMLLPRLREVRALQSFTRVESPEPELRSRWAPLAAREVDWLPAIEVVGEGVFLALDSDRLRRWETHEGVQERAERIRRNHLALLSARWGDAKAAALSSPVTPRFVLLHTLAHTLINEWSLDAGYPAAALRERLYASDPMAGFLLYTATSDSAGSLGGVVGQGEPENLLRSLRSALARMDWCSSDPLCMESEASGVDGLNLAACHSCALLPETCCETNNVFLDRGLLLGTRDGRTPGFFASLH